MIQKAELVGFISWMSPLNEMIQKAELVGFDKKRLLCWPFLHSRSSRGPFFLFCQIQQFFLLHFSSKTNDSWEISSNHSLKNWTGDRTGEPYGSGFYWSDQWLTGSLSGFLRYKILYFTYTCWIFLLIIYAKIFHTSKLIHNNLCN
jgi:hypothetical protein